MNRATLTVVESGWGAALQDRGRPGWRRFGVPPGGVMDDHAAGWANRLLDNPPDAPVIELLLHGATFEVLRAVWIAVTGSQEVATVPSWRATRVEAGAVIRFPPTGHFGVWSYLAVEGGFQGRRWFGSASVHLHGGMGARLAPGDSLVTALSRASTLPTAIAGRTVAREQERRYDQPPVLRVWPGPQWDSFHERDRELFFSQSWRVSTACDRVGYRLEGSPLNSLIPQLVSEPVRVGTIQVPGNGLPIVTMRDGPTVGGYPKLGLVDPGDLSWLAQCRPGQVVRFAPVG